MSFDWQSVVKSVAPTLGTALGGPMGGMATKFLSEKFLGKSDGGELELAKAIASASPEQMLQIKQLDNDFALQMKQLDIDVFALAVQDRDSARQLFKVNIWPQIILSSIYTIGYFGLLGFLMHLRNEDFNPQVFGILTTVMGVLTAAIPQILQFWFGSSQGSKEKTSNMKTG